jgi:hypothetical protein
VADIGEDEAFVDGDVGGVLVGGVVGGALIGVPFPTYVGIATRTGHKTRARSPLPKKPEPIPI